MVPSIVVAELLCNLDPKVHNDFNKLILRNFIVPPFDSQAALYFGKIWQQKRQGHNKVGVSRAEMKADFMITATALARGAKCIYTEDIALQKFARDFIEVRPLPSVQEQLNLLD